jgi:tetratricopeptide (TPR) repeat protein/TolB-like protein
MGEVHRAFDSRLQRHVALKRIRDDHASPKARARFWREARALAALKHPDLVAIHDIGEEAGGLYLAMELIEGAPLSQALGRPWPAAAALALGASVARALGSAHAAGIVHRDVKPGNILVEPTGRPRIIDFGLARRDSDDDALTGHGTVVGTASFMSPEQIRGDLVTPATDVFALGAVLYALLAGSSPFSRDSREATVAAVLANAHVHLAKARPDLPRGLADLIEQCLSPNANRRPTDGTALADALDELMKAHGPIAIARIAEAMSGGTSVSPGSATGIAVQRPARSRRPYVIAAATALGLGVLAAVVFSGAATSRDANTVDTTPSDATATRPPSEPEPRALVAPKVDPTTPRPPDGVRPVREGKLPARMHGPGRKVVAVLPFKDTQAGVGDLVAEGVRHFMDFAPNLASVPLRAMVAMHGKAPEGLAPEGFLSASSGHGVDLLVSGEVATQDDVARVTLTISEPGAREPLWSKVVEGSSREPLLLAKEVAETFFAELGEVPRDLPLPTSSARAWRALMEARLALHREHWRSVRALTATALESDPELVPARLIQARIAMGLTQPAEVAAQLAAARAHLDRASPRDASALALLELQSDPKLASGFSKAAEAHLLRWPRDLEVRLDLLRAQFAAHGAGSLRRAAEAAGTILQGMPATPTAASKMVRAYAWLGEADRAKARLASFGITPDMPMMGIVFAELDLYEGRYDAAIAGFAKALEPDGLPSFFAANMSLAAMILAGKSWDAVVYGKSLIAADKLDEAREAVERWSENTGTQGAATIYAYLRWDIDLLQGRKPKSLEAELTKRVESTPKGASGDVYRLLARVGSDPKKLRAWAETLASGIIGATEARSVRFQIDERLRQSLAARADLLSGQVERGLATFEALARPGAFEITNEGDVFDVTRFERQYAEALDALGRRDEAEVVWRRILSHGYPRLLCMDITVQAQRRLGLPVGVPPQDGGGGPR